jgi:two-component system OmpR family response regulator
MSHYRLLVIEDEKNIADMLCRVSEDIGFDVKAVSQFEEIPTLYKIFVPDVIVLDIVMPEMDGFEVLKLLHRYNSASRVIIISGQDDYRLMALRMGEALSISIDAAIAKPFRVDELRRILESIRISLLESSKVSSNQHSK